MLYLHDQGVGWPEFYMIYSTYTIDAESKNLNWNTEWKQLIVQHVNLESKNKSSKFILINLLDCLWKQTLNWTLDYFCKKETIRFRA